MGAPGTALVKPRDAILAAVDKYGAEITALAPEGADLAHYTASLRLYFAQNPKVLDCTPASVAVGMLRVAQTGLELGVSCDLLPFGKACQFSPRYGGIVELALGAGTRSINADVVREGDDFEMAKGTSPYLRHQKKAKHGAKITHAYAIAEIRVNSYVFECLTREEVDEIRLRYSKSWAKGSLDDIPWYARKTCIRRLTNYLPKNPRLAAALLYADEKPEELPDDIPVGECAPLPCDADGVVTGEPTEAQSFADRETISGGELD
jgi:phage RecT family recombinase